MNGILLIDKPSGWTSFDVVNYVRKMVASREGKKPKHVKVGLYRGSTVRNCSRKRLGIVKIIKYRLRIECCYGLQWLPGRPRIGSNGGLNSIPGLIKASAHTGWWHRCVG